MNNVSWQHVDVVNGAAKTKQKKPTRAGLEAAAEAKVAAEAAGRDG